MMYSSPPHASLKSLRLHDPQNPLDLQIQLNEENLHATFSRKNYMDDAGTLAKAWPDSSIAPELSSSDAPLLPIIIALLSEARKLKLPLEAVSAWASSDLLKTCRAESNRLPSSLAPLAPCIRDLVLRNPQLIKHILSVTRPHEILKNLAVFESSHTTPAFVDAKAITSDRAQAAFARAAAVARGENPMKSRKGQSKTPKLAKVCEIAPKTEDETLPGLIDLDEDQSWKPPSIAELMKHGLSRKGAEIALARLNEQHTTTN